MADWSRHIELGDKMNQALQLTEQEKAEAVNIFPQIIEHLGALFVSISEFESRAGVPIEEWVPGQQDYDDWHLAAQYYCAEGSRYLQQTYSQIFDSRFPPNAPLQEYDYTSLSYSAQLILESALSVKGFYGAEEDSPYGRPEMQEDKSLDPNDPEQLEQIVMVPWDGGESDVLVDQPIPAGEYELGETTNAAPWEDIEEVD